MYFLPVCVNICVHRNLTNSALQAGRNVQNPPNGQSTEHQHCQVNCPFGGFCTFPAASDAELVRFPAREERCSPRAGQIRRPWRRPGTVRGSFSRHLVDFANFLLLCRIGDILRQRGAFRPLAGLMPRPWRRPGRGRGSFSRPRPDGRTTSSDRPARVTWPPDHLTTWPPDQLTRLAPYWPNT